MKQYVEHQAEQKDLSEERILRDHKSLCYYCKKSKFCEKLNVGFEQKRIWVNFYLIITIIKYFFF